jgi:hypothetical protein
MVVANPFHIAKNTARVKINGVIDTAEFYGDFNLSDLGLSTKLSLPLSLPRSLRPIVPQCRMIGPRSEDLRSVRQLQRLLKV